MVITGSQFLLSILTLLIIVFFFLFINLILKSQMSFIILLDFFNSREIDIFFYDYL